MTTSPPLRVLLVEDESLIRWSISTTLANAGHIVVEAGSARGAVETLQTQPSQPIDVVLLDFRLPDSSDLGLLAAIRRIRPDSAVVLMTAYGAPEVKEGALNMGAFRVLDKPFDMNILAPLLQEAHAAQLH